MDAALRVGSNKFEDGYRFEQKQMRCCGWEEKRRWGKIRMRSFGTNLMRRLLWKLIIKRMNNESLIQKYYKEI
jgi:hypothetical protein